MIVSIGFTPIGDGSALASAMYSRRTSCVSPNGSTTERASVLTVMPSRLQSRDLARSRAAMRVITDARAAIGGEAKLAAVKSFIVTGRTRQVRGDNLVPIEFEIMLELPDKYLRADEFPAEDTDPTSSGFNGDALIQVPPPATGPAPGRPMPTPGAAPPATGAAPGTTPAAGRGPAPGVVGAHACALVARASVGA